MPGARDQNDDSSSEEGGRIPAGLDQKRENEWEEPSKEDSVDGALENVLQQAGVDTGDPNVQRTLKVMRVTLARGSLPLPPPSILREYAEIIPGLPEKFVKWTEAQAAHRRELEWARANGRELRMSRGQIGALLVSVVGLCISGAVGIYGSAVVASVIAIVCVGGPAAAVVIANRTNPPGLPAQRTKSTSHRKATRTPTAEH